MNQAAVHSSPGNGEVGEILNELCPFDHVTGRYGCIPPTFALYFIALGGRNGVRATALKITTKL